DWPPDDDALGRSGARRRPPESQQSRLGQARLQLVLRAVERRGNDRRHAERALRPGEAARASRALRSHDVLRTAHRGARAHTAAARFVPRAPARAGERRRAAQSGSDYAGAPGLGPDDPRWLRPDGNHDPDRELPRPATEGRIDGTAGAGTP